MVTPPRGCVIVAAYLAGIAGVLCAKSENPLDRTTPVPADTPIPAIDFFRPSLFRDPQLNDAGTLFAAMVTAGADREELLVYDFETAKFDRLHGVGDKDVYDFDWLDDDRLLFALSSEKRYREGLYVANARALGENYFVDLHNVSLVVARPESGRQRPVIWIKHSAYDRGKDGGVFQIDAEFRPNNPFASGMYVDPSSIDHGTTAFVVRSYPDAKPGIPTWYSADLEGNLAYAYTIENGIRRLLRLVGNRWEVCPVNLDDIDVVGSERDGRLVVCGPRQEGKPRALQYMDAATGQLGEVIWQDDKYDPSNCRLYRHPVSKRLLGIRFDRAMRETVWFDLNYRAIQQAIAQLLPGVVVQILGSDKAEKRFFIAALSDRRPMTYYSVDLEKRVLGLIKCQAPWIDPERMCATSVINYKSRDGLAVEGYLTLPSGASKTNPAPLVVLAHGGPWARDTWGFDGEVQFLASRGYAVFQPNYRGSLGFEWRIQNTDLYEFRKMHDDVTDGVQKVLRTGLLDPDRVAIMGWSFGGYLALSGAVHEGRLYRCAVALSGVYDWAQVMSEAKLEEYVRGRYGFLRRHLGDPKTNVTKFDEISPLRHVAKVQIPVFVGHGTADVIADADQSRRLVAALKQTGVPVVARFEGGEGHGMARMKNRIEMYEEIEKFLAVHMAPRPKLGAPTSAARP